MPTLLKGKQSIPCEQGMDHGKVKTTLYKVRWRGYDRKGDTWEPITHLQGYASMVKAFNESHEKDVERLAADRRSDSGQNQKKHMLSLMLPNILCCP
jgi:hypothetical protein